MTTSDLRVPSKPPGGIASFFATPAPPSRRALVLAIITAATFLGILFAQLVRYVVGADAEYSVGSVAARDLRAQFRVTYVSDIETNRQRDLVAAAVSPIYTPPDAQVARRQLAVAREVLDRITQVRVSGQGETPDGLRQLQNLPNLPLDLETAQTLLRVGDARWSSMAAQVVSLIDESMRGAIRADNIDAVKARLPNLISLVYTAEEADAISALTSGLLVPNTSFDTAGTNAARKRARDAVRPVERTFEAGQIVIRSGEVLGPADVEALERLNLQRSTVAWSDVGAALLVSTFATLTLILAVHHGIGWRAIRVRRTLLSASLLVVALILARWLLPGRQSGAFLAPLAVVGMAVTAWSGPLTGAVASVLLGGLVGMGTDRTAELTTFYAAGALIAGLALPKVERISDFMRAGGLALLVQLVILGAFELPGWYVTRDASTLMLNAAATLAGGMIAGALAPVVLYVAGWMFGINTPLQLIELSRPSHPLFQRMIATAPGTYHHSLMVANLAEQAAERIHADSLLVRVGAYYHDIGKMVHPYFFSENQLDGKNVHDQLDPLTSARVLHAHVSDGLKLAAEHRLPSNIRAFIAEHHGTTRTGSPYVRAVKAAGNVDIDDAPYRYPGPRPTSRESALVMLADASEAIVRARRSSSLEQTDEIVRKMIADRIADHQLDDCDISMRDLAVIRQSFLETLRGMYHPRVAYPEMPAKALAPPAAQPADPAQFQATHEVTI